MFFIWFQWIVKNYIYNEEQIFPSQVLLKIGKAILAVAAGQGKFNKNFLYTASLEICGTPHFAHIGVNV